MLLAMQTELRRAWQVLPDVLGRWLVVMWVGFAPFLRLDPLFTEANCAFQLWAISIRDNPSGYYFGFVICAGVCALSLLQSFLIR